MWFLIFCKIRHIKIHTYLYFNLRFNWSWEWWWWWCFRNFLNYLQIHDTSSGVALMSVEFDDSKAGFRTEEKLNMRPVPAECTLSPISTRPCESELLWFVATAVGYKLKSFPLICFVLFCCLFIYITFFN